MSDDTAALIRRHNLSEPVQHSLVTQLCKVEAELAEAKKDSARLDWLGDKCPATIDGPRITFHLERYAPSLRSSIDAAMEASK